MKSIYQFSLSSLPVEKGQTIRTLHSLLKELEVRGLLSVFLEMLFDDRVEKMVCLFYD